MESNKIICYILLSFTFLLGCEQQQPQLQSISNPTQQQAQYPHLFGSGDKLYMSWISSQDTTHSLNYARYSDGNWNSPTLVAQGSNWFVNWADFPSVVGTQKAGAAHWLQKKPGGTYAYDVQIATANSSGKWSQGITPHTDSTATEHGFASMIPWKNNTTLAVWLDGRRTADRNPEEYYDISKAMTLRGAIIAADGQILQRFLIDESVCDCCQTTLVKTKDGAMVAYRNRTGDEIRDIYHSRFDGQQWSTPQTVYQDSWKIGACPVNGPQLAAADSTVLLAWHTEADDNPRAKAAISTDDGQTFGSPFNLNKKPSLGRVDAALYSGTAYVSWMEQAGQNQQLANLQLGSFSVRDTALQTQHIASINSSRQTGFPQMEVIGDELIFAWTNVDSANTSILTRKMQLLK